MVNRYELLITAGNIYVPFVEVTIPSFFLLHSNCNMNNMTGATSGGGSCLAGAMCLPPVFGEFRVAQCSICLLFSVLWTIILPFMACPVYCLSFVLHLHTHHYWTWIYRFSYLSLFFKYLHIHSSTYHSTSMSFRCSVFRILTHMLNSWLSFCVAIYKIISDLYDVSLHQCCLVSLLSEFHVFRLRVRLHEHLSSSLMFLCDPCCSSF